ncbi:MAG: STAS domain-containing protein [Planctomycetota bacterium]|jgi:anti-anti-sigma factor
MAMTHYELDSKPGGIVVHLLGNVDSMNFDSVLDEIEHRIEELSPPRLLLDFTGIGMLQSSRLTRLIRLADACRSVGCELQLCGLQEYCRRVLTVTQLDRVVSVYSTEADALETWTTDIQIEDQSPPSTQTAAAESTPAAPATARSSPDAPRRSQRTASGTPNLRRAIRLRRDESTAETFAWGKVSWKIGPPANGSEFNRVARVDIFAHQGEPFHRHPETEEIVIVLSGDIEYWIDRYSHHLTAGDTVTVPPSVVHGCYNTTDTAAQMLVIHAPIPDDDTPWLEEDVSRVEPWKSMLAKRGYAHFDVHWKDSTMVLHVKDVRLLDSISVDEFATALTAIDDEHHPERLVIDLADVSFIASSVLGILTRHHQKMIGQGRILRLCSLTPQVKEVFEITQLSKLIPLHDSVGSAVSSFV